MKKYFVFILICLLINCISYAAKESNVKIKAGIILKSGDIKIVARQDFLVTKADLIAILRTSKKNHIKDMKSIEEEIKAEMDYSNKINSLQNELDKYQDELNRQKVLSDMYGVDGKIRKEILDKLEKCIDRSIDYHSKEPMEKNFLFIKLNSLKYGMDNARSYDEFRNKVKEEIIGPIEWFYKQQLEKKISLTFDYEDQIKELKEIRDLIDKHEPDVSAINAKILKLRNEIKKLKDEINMLKNELKSKIDERLIFYENKATNDFQVELKKASSKTFQTNLNGEASLIIERGQYYIFGMAEIGQNKIIWNFPVNIKEKEHYFELSNDNAFAINDDILFFELLEALKGFR